MTRFATTWPRLFAVALLAATVAACPEFLCTASAQDAAPQAAPAKPHKSRAQNAGPAAGPGADAGPVAKDPAAASRNYTEGVKAFQSGRLPEAIQQMSAAMAAGLPANLMPKALYYRGSSYIQMHEPGLAISDFNSALFFKDGLDEGERAEARKRRSAAYRDAGLDEPAESGARAVAAGGAGDATKEAVPSQPGFGDGLGNLFGGLFGGSSSPAPQAQSQAHSEPPAPATTAALLNGPHKVIEPEGGSDAASQPEVLPWAKNGEAAQSSAEPQAPAAQPPPVAPAARQAAKAPSHNGKYRIQVASVPSRDEASSVIATLQSKGEPLATAPVSVDPLKFGTNTYYRVRLGPYATAADTKAPCEALKAAGLDCLVTAQ